MPDKACARCGKTFRPNVAVARFCDDKCRSQSRAEWESQYYKELRNGSRHTKLKSVVQFPPCKQCGNAVKARRHKYCSRQCFCDGRKSGEVAWDRTGQDLGQIKRAIAQGQRLPSQSMCDAISKSVAGHSASVNSLWKSLNNFVSCLKCDGPLKEHAHSFTKFCSIDCSANYEHIGQCGVCGSQYKRIGVQGGRGRCPGCVRKAKRQEKRLHGNHRRRCRAYGGRYNSKVTSDKVFDRDGFRCHVCGKNTLPASHYLDPRHPTVDHHPVPLSKGGDHDWHNVRCACRLCNARKGAAWNGQQALRLQW